MWNKTSFKHNLEPMESSPQQYNETKTFQLAHNKFIKSKWKFINWTITNTYNYEDLI